ncbi:MAG: DUF5681 domain-containing protein [bacterium]
MPYNPKSLENLQPHMIQEGEVRNPQGRPKDTYRISESEVWEELLNEEITIDDKKTKTREEIKRARALAKRLFTIAMNAKDTDSIAASKIIFERAFGKSKKEEPEADVPQKSPYPLSEEEMDESLMRFAIKQLAAVGIEVDWEDFLLRQKNLKMRQGTEVAA